MTPIGKFAVHPAEALQTAKIKTVCNKLVHNRVIIFIITLKFHLGSSKFFLEMNHNIIEFLTKTQPEPVHHLGEKLKTSPTLKFAANPEIALQTLTV
jgi:hypothetical protein